MVCIQPHSSGVPALCTDCSSLMLDGQHRTPPRFCSPLPLTAAWRQHAPMRQHILKHMTLFFALSESHLIKCHKIMSPVQQRHSIETTAAVFNISSQTVSIQCRVNALLAMPTGTDLDVQPIPLFWQIQVVKPLFLSDIGLTPLAKSNHSVFSLLSHDLWPYGWRRTTS